MSSSCFDDPGVSPYISSTVESLRLGMVVSGEVTGTFCNAEAVRLLGLPHPRTPLQAWDQHVTFHDGSGRAPAINNPLLDSREGQSIRRKRIELVQTGGKRHCALLCLTHLEVRPVATVMLLEDLVWEQPEQREREKWLAAVGHEMRGALQAVMMGTAFVSEAGDSPASRRHLASIGRNVHLLARLVDDMTQSALVADGALHVRAVPVLLRPFLEQATASADFEGHQHDFVLDVAMTACALADPDRLQQIVTNLFANAAKYSAPGKLTLRAELRHGEVVISLSDQGPGIRMEDQRRLFTRYGRLPSKREGLGIGLWMCRELARRMGGDMWLRSTPGIGTTFFVALPRHGVTQEMPAVPMTQSAS